MMLCALSEFLFEQMHLFTRKVLLQNNEFLKKIESLILAQGQRALTNRESLPAE